MPRPPMSEMDLFINADGGLSCVHDGHLISIPMGAADAMNIVAIWTAGQKSGASCGDQYAALALKALITGAPESQRTPHPSAGDGQDPRTQAYTPRFSGMRPGWSL